MFLPGSSWTKQYGDTTEPSFPSVLSYPQGPFPLSGCQRYLWDLWGPQSPETAMKKNPSPPWGLLAPEPLLQLSSTHFTHWGNWGLSGQNAKSLWEGLSCPLLGSHVIYCLGPKPLLFSATWWFIWDNARLENLDSSLESPGERVLNSGNPW